MVLVRPDARTVAGAQGDFRIALDILRGVAVTLADVRHPATEMAGTRPERREPFPYPGTHAR